MPLTPNFSASQLIGLPEQIVITDTSTGSDINIASRKLYIQTANGEYLIDGEVWSYADDEITVDCLEKDEAVNITVNWLDASNNILYTLTDLFEFNQFNNQFSVDLTRAIASNPAIMQDADYWMNKIKLRVNIDVALADDVYLAQTANDRATYLRLHQNIFF
jgi:hypothetical protein